MIYGCTIVHMTFKTYQKGFRNLRAWQEAHKLAIDLYKLTADFPREDRYGLVDQLRRSSSSIGALIAEGASMKSSAHQRSYYVRAHGSSAEVDHHLEFAHAIGRITDIQYEHFLKRINYIASLVGGLVCSQKLYSPQNP